jgi:hypothetical protein
MMATLLSTLLLRLPNRQYAPFQNPGLRHIGETSRSSPTITSGKINDSVHGTLRAFNALAL